ncbi:MAG: 2-dehydropantoate 2-reductase [Burkholderiales bacterium]
MRIAVIGTGGVGGYFGGRLAQAGHEVAFLARGAHLAALRERGLVIESGSGNATIANAVFTDDIAAIPPCDVAMVCVKLWDVEATAGQLSTLLAKGGVAIPFQNGVDAPDILGRALGEERVLGGIAYIAATIRAPGVIAHTGSMARLVAGAFDPRTASAAQAFRDACASGNVQCDVSADVRRALWEKFCMLSAMSGCTSMARQPVGVIRGDPDLRATFEAAVAEAAAVGRARGVALADEYVARQLAFLDGLPAEMRSSMQNDLAAGRRLEAPWLSGAVVRMARESGLAAPVSATLYAAAKPYVDGARRDA